MAVTNNNINNSTDNDLFVNSFSNDGASESLEFNKSRAGGVITTGDALGAIFFSGFDGTNFIPAAKISVSSTGTIGAGRVAGIMTFQTHPDSASVATTRLTIANTGAITVATPDSGVGLTIAGGGLDVTGTTTLHTPLGISSGGTNTSVTPGTDALIYFDGTRYVGLTNGTTGQILTATTGSAPSWGSVSTGVTSITGTANQITASASTGAITLSIPSTFIAPGSIASTTSVTAGNGFTVTAGTITLTPLNTSGIVVNNASGVISTSATTNHALQVGTSSGQLSSLATGTSGQLLQSAGALDPAWTTATYPSTTMQGDILYSSSANNIAGLAKDTNATRYLSNTGTSNNPAWAQVALATGVSGVLPIANGGTNTSTTPGTNAVMYFDGTKYVGLTNGTTGQVLTATTGSAPSWGTSSGGGVFWVATSAAETSMAINTGYVGTASSGTQGFTLPLTSSIGDIVGVVNIPGSSIVIRQNASQRIHEGASATTTGVTGTVTFGADYTSVQLICTQANLTWTVLANTGILNFT